VHEARPDVAAVMHTHTVAGIAVSALKEGLLPLSQTALGYYNSVRYHDYEGLALVDDEKARLAADLGDGSAMILRNHGLLTAAASVAETFLALFMLQKACEVQVAALSAGRDLIHQPQEMADLVALQSQSAFGLGAQMSWNALLRKMDRLDSSFRT
jgi:ribulose-5-phosphate 4-epimerase/fuculose-1-phosphate aldolase